MFFLLVYKNIIRDYIDCNLFFTKYKLMLYVNLVFRYAQVVSISSKITDESANTPVLCGYGLKPKKSVVL